MHVRDNGGDCVLLFVLCALSSPLYSLLVGKQLCLPEWPVDHKLLIFAQVINILLKSAAKISCTTSTITML